MKCKSLVGMTLMLLSAPAFAGSEIQRVEVRPESRPRLAFECAAPVAARPAEVERLLRINDRSQTHQLGNRLMGAVQEACEAGVSNIVVQRGANGGSVTWRAAAAYEASVALN